MRRRRTDTRRRRTDMLWVLHLNIDVAYSDCAVVGALYPHKYVVQLILVNGKGKEEKGMYVCATDSLYCPSLSTPNIHYYLYQPPSSPPPYKWEEGPTPEGEGPTCCEYSILIDVAYADCPVVGALYPHKYVVQPTPLSQQWKRQRRERYVCATDSLYCPSLSSPNIHYHLYHPPHPPYKWEEGGPTPEGEGPTCCEYSILLRIVPIIYQLVSYEMPYIMTLSKEHIRE